MHPMMAWWGARRASRCSPSFSHSCGPGPAARHEVHPHDMHHGDFDEGAGPFGVRRPLRFLAHKLGLDERQIAELARVLDDLKTERAQAALDHRRSISAFADLVAGDTFDEARARDAAQQRVKSAEALRDALVKALGRMHALLGKEQREKLAYLLRTGVLSM